MTVPMEYTKEDGLHVMAACGHYVSGAVVPDDKIALCPNCQLIFGITGKVKIIYPSQLPEAVREDTIEADE